MPRPAVVKVQIFEARDILAADKVESSDPLNPFALIRFGEDEHKTSVCRRSSAPIWHDEAFRFDTDESTLHEQPLEIHLIDHESYSANDAIGCCILNLANLLHSSTASRVEGWLQLLDPVNGHRGEVRISVKVDVQARLQAGPPFSSTSTLHGSAMKSASRQGQKPGTHRCQPLVLNSSILPNSLAVSSLLGLVDSGYLRDDCPEAEWRDRLRSARSSDTAQQLMLTRLLMKLQHRVAVRAVERGGNAVLGYQVFVEADSSGGMIARAYGTSAVVEELTRTGTPSFLALPSILRHPSGGNDNTQPLLYTLTSFPEDCIQKYGGIIAVRAVRVASSGDPAVRTGELYRRWYDEMRQELQNQIEAVDCNAGMGYREQLSVSGEVVVLSASATAVLMVVTDRYDSEKASPQIHALSRSWDRASFDKEKSAPPIVEDLAEPKRQSPSPTSRHSCSLFHFPARYSTFANGGFLPCAGCKPLLPVAAATTLSPSPIQCPIIPQSILATVDIPATIQSLLKSGKARPGLLRICISRRRNENASEAAAKELSELLPVLDDDLYREIEARLRLEHWNAAFNVEIQLVISDELVSVVATGTGLSLEALLPINSSPSVQQQQSPHAPVVVASMIPTGTAPVLGFVNADAAMSLRNGDTLNSFALLYRSMTQPTATSIDRLVQLTRFRLRRHLCVGVPENPSVLAGIRVRCWPGGDTGAATSAAATGATALTASTYWLLTGTLISPAVMADNNGDDQQPKSPSPPSGLPMISVLPNCGAASRHLVRLSLTSVRESDNISLVISEAHDVLRSLAQLLGASVVLSVRLDHCHFDRFGERHAIVVVSGDAAI